MNLNMANRQCCDLDIRDYKTNEPLVIRRFLQYHNSRIYG